MHNTNRNNTPKIVRVKSNNKQVEIIAAASENAMSEIDGQWERLCSRPTPNPDANPNRDHATKEELYHALS